MAALEKQVLEFDVTKGLNESARKETANPKETLTTLYDMVQEFDGAWSKRPGMAVFCSSIADITGASITPMRRAFRTPFGLGMIAGSGRLLQINEKTDKPSDKGRVSEYGVQNFGMASLEGGSRATTVQSCVENQYYNFMAITTVVGTQFEAFLYIYDKEGQHVIKKHQLSSYGFNTATVAGTPMTVRIAVAGYYYVIVAVTRADECRIFRIDTTIALTNTLTATQVVAPTGSLQTPSLVDVSSDTAYAHFLFRDIPGNAGGHSLYRTGTNGVISEQYNIPGGANVVAWSICNDRSYIYTIYKDAANTYIRRNAYTAYATTVIACQEAVVPTCPCLLACQNATAPTTAAFCVVKYDTYVPSAGYKIQYTDAYVTGMGAASVFPAATRVRIPGWVPVSHPFYNWQNAKFYLHVSKCSLASAPSPTDNTYVNEEHAIVCLSDYGSVYTSYNNVPVSALLDGYNAQGVFSGYTSYTTPTEALAANVLQPAGTYPDWQFIRLQDLDYYGKQWMTAFYRKLQGTTVGIVMSRLISNDHDRCYNATDFGGQSVVAGGCVHSYDGTRVYETAWIDRPVLTYKTTAGAGVAAGTYNFVAVYRFVDSQGNNHYSRVSNVISVVLGGAVASIDISGPIPTVTSKPGTNEPTAVLVDIYSTTLTQYKLLLSNVAGTVATIAQPGVWSWSCTSPIGTGATLFRQPGTTGTALDRYPPPPSSLVCSHKDRLFTTDAYDSGRVYYSSFFVDTEGPWFNPRFVTVAHGAGGPITGLVSMDGRLIIFKKTAIFVMDGEGPPENGGSGSEFTSPQRLSTEYGCVNSKSICVTPDGIMYRSNRGFELLTRSLQVEFVGRQVSDSLLNYVQTITPHGFPNDVSAVYDTRNGLARFMVAWQQYSAYPGTYNGVMVYVYDTINKCWSIHRPTDGGVYANNSQFSGMVLAPAANPGPDTEKMFYLNPARLFVEDNTIGYDYYSAGEIKPVIETGWLRVNGLQGKQRIYDILVLLKNNDKHNLKLSLAYNFSTTYTQTVTFGPSITSSGVEELSIQPSNQTPVAIRLKIEETGAAAGVTTYRGFDLLGISLQVSPKVGAQQLDATKKG